MSDNDTGFWNSAYKSAPDAMRPVYSMVCGDGMRRVMPMCPTQPISWL